MELLEKAEMLGRPRASDGKKIERRLNEQKSARSWMQITNVGSVTIN